ncbi:MAG: BrnT family toxin [Verrucomicrobiota bacterium]
MSHLKAIAAAEGFEWDSGNSLKSLTKHKVNSNESEQVFRNRPLLLLDDDTHSQKEVRYKAFGKTDHKRLLTVSYTLRGKKIRIISARPMHRKERKIYEKAKK